jgi:hypothetical protein
MNFCIKKHFSHFSGKIALSGGQIMSNIIEMIDGWYLQDSEKSRREEKRKETLAKLSKDEQLDYLREEVMIDEAIASASQTMRGSSMASKEKDYLDQALAILEQYGARLFSPPPIQPDSRNSIARSIHSVPLDQLQSGEGGFCVPWLVGKKEIKITQAPLGTSCIPIWKDKEGQIHWNHASVEEYYRKNM